MLMRLRRYRLVLAVAVLSVLLVYHLTRNNAWDSSSLEALVGLGSHHAGKVNSLDADAAVQPPPLLVPAPVSVQSSPSPIDVLESIPSPRIASEIVTSLSLPANPQATITGEELLLKQTNADKEFGQYGEGRSEVKPRPAEQHKAYWKQQAEHFPVPSHSLKLLPSGDPKALPKVQYNFDKEKGSAKKLRLQRQSAVLEAFKHAWFGYKNHSLPHDELKPISKDVGDPFNGWGATLVDSLDTLWIMGLQHEFEDAVHVVSKIDFKTSARKDIPLFETVIRYLGGLIAAYDLSSGQYPILLDKAVELADILMGAFDTPNRMPQVFYNWAPSYASQSHRASPHTVLAEIGSLAMEFTRLAQITKEPKYYDAIARITDALEEWQMKTTLPGLWPLRLDASGCKKPEKPDLLTQATEDDEHVSLPESLASEMLSGDAGRAGLEKLHVTEVQPASGDEVLNPLTKRQQLSSAPPRDQPEHEDSKIPAAEEQTKPVVKADWDEEDLENIDCEPQGLSTEPSAKTHTYGIGSMADSTYEYFPKEYALLGGLNQQYQTMYVKAMDVVREELLFRPMTKQNHDILFLAKKNISPKHKIAKKRKETFYEGTHLGCYAGGMFALGSKLFDIPSDMAIAERLTNGCVWAYASTPAGIMPEEFELAACESLTSCKWDQAKWHEALDPRLDERVEAVEKYNLRQQVLYEEKLATIDKILGKRYPPAEVEEPLPTKTFITDDDEIAVDDSITQSFTPMVALSHEKYVAAKIQEERLPPGYTKITARDYRLRPEAIESIFIMYRLTGDRTWQDKGWTMFEAVDKATKIEIAHAGVKDVTSLLGEQQDTMESFWLAETLKYYYLLFSQPDLISLDDYVLNTEAHPFRRPKADVS